MSWRCWRRSREAELLRVKSPNRSSGVVASGWAGAGAAGSQGGPASLTRLPSDLGRRYQRHRLGRGFRRKTSTCYFTRKSMRDRPAQCQQADTLGSHRARDPSASRLPDHKVPPQKELPSLSRHATWILVNCAIHACGSDADSAPMKKYIAAVTDAERALSPMTLCVVYPFLKNSEGPTARNGFVFSIPPQQPISSLPWSLSLSLVFLRHSHPP